MRRLIKTLRGGNQGEQMRKTGTPHSAPPMPPRPLPENCRNFYLGLELADKSRLTRLPRKPA